MNHKMILGFILAAMLLLVGCAEDTLEIEETPQAPPAPEPEPEPEPVMEEPEEVMEENETTPGDEDIVEEESTADKFAVFLLKNLAVSPSEVTIKVGGTVMWKSEDTGLLHIIGWSKQPVRAPGLKYGDSWNHTFTEPGEVIWFSTARPSLQGKIIIEE